MIWLGWVFHQSQPFSNSSFFLARLCLCVCGREGGRERSRAWAMLTDDFFLSCQVSSLSAALLVSGGEKKNHVRVGGASPEGPWAATLTGTARGQPYRQRMALGPVQPPHCPAALADSSVVSKGFSSPPPLIKIPQLVLLIVSLAYCKKKKKRGKKEKNPCGFAIWRWASNPLGQPEDGGVLAQLPPAYTWALEGCPRSPTCGEGGEVAAKNVGRSRAALKVERVHVWGAASVLTEL